jgi:hypothetical protein
VLFPVPSAQMMMFFGMATERTWTTAAAWACRREKVAPAALRAP